MNRKELLREWISTRQFSNIEDPIVSLLIEKCSKPKNGEEERKFREAERMRAEEREDAHYNNDYDDDAYGDGDDDDDDDAHGDGDAYSNGDDDDD